MSGNASSRNSQGLFNSQQPPNSNRQSSSVVISNEPKTWGEYQISHTNKPSSKKKQPPKNVIETMDARDEEYVKEKLNEILKSHTEVESFTLSYSGFEDEFSKPDFCGIWMDDRLTYEKAPDRYIYDHPL